MLNLFGSTVSQSCTVSVHTAFGAALGVRLGGNAAEKLPQSWLWPLLVPLGVNILFFFWISPRAC